MKSRREGQTIYYRLTDHQFARFALRHGLATEMTLTLQATAYLSRCFWSSSIRYAPPATCSIT